MPDPFLKATLDQAIASGQWIVQNRSDWQNNQQTLGLCATTVGNYACQVILKDNSVVPIGAASTQDVAPRLAMTLTALESIRLEMTASQASGDKASVTPAVLQVIVAVIALLKELFIKQ